ncbi:MAG TPA: hypothetical protein VGA53_02270 [Candidatus Paceibacterota bacterium]
MGKNIFYFILAAAILLLVGGVVFFFTQQRAAQEPAQSPEGIEAGPPQSEGLGGEQGLGSELNQNPGSKVPETNPLEGYRNPFE